LHQCSNAAIPSRRNPSILNKKQKRVRPIACINAAMQPFLHAEIKGAEPDCIRSKEGLKLKL